jgi:hypothetical protein
MRKKPGIQKLSEVTTVKRAIAKQKKYAQLPPQMLQKLILQQKPQDLIEAAQLNQPLENNSIEALEKLSQALNNQYRIRVLVLQDINPDAKIAACADIHLLNNVIIEIQTLINSKRNKQCSPQNTAVQVQWAEQQLMDFTTAYESKTQGSFSM